LVTALAPTGEPAKPSPRELLERADRLLSEIARASEELERRRAEAQTALRRAREELVSAQLATMPIDRLRDTTSGRLRLGALQRGGVRTVGAALEAGARRLQVIPGVGPQTATQVIGAARQLRRALEESVRLRFDPIARPERQADLLIALRLHGEAEAAVGPLLDEIRSLKAAAPLRDAAAPTASWIRMLFAGGARRREAKDALARLEALLDEPGARGAAERLARSIERLDGLSAMSANEAWEDFEARVAEYNGLLIDLGGMAPGEEAVRGYIPAEVAERIHQHPLNVDSLTASLRGYQAFGAKFALAQRRAILGDEMGLGKTVEALGAIGHLWSAGETHFLVVCPASVVVNWDHEARRHSTIPAHRVHGDDRVRALRRWQREGGIAITTFGSLRHVDAADDTRLSMLVVDEAHYVKNPEAGRTRETRRWIERADRTLFLTGTPMENRVDEFKVLVGHLQPEVAESVRSIDGMAGAAAFRQAVATVYLRRNQEDVLQELPPRIDVEDWIELAAADLAAYREAVASGNFMAMRQAPYAAGLTGGSAKLGRLVEIAREAMEDGRKVVVFSYFRSVLGRVIEALDGRALGPITGAVAPVDRQALIDEFTKRRAPCVLVSQIESGGVGLNIQAASVVILAEPQWKPSVEDQAVARCHRMGQARTVNVHRLLAQGSADERMLEILQGKRTLIDEYVRKSDLKEASADAVDVSDIAATHEAVSQAEAERAIIEAERRRLGIEIAEPGSVLPGESSA